MADTKNENKSKKDKKDKNKKHKDKKKQKWGKLAGAFSKSKKNVVGLYEDKKQPEKTWMAGEKIMTRKWVKMMEIEYDSNPEAKTNDKKSHKHVAELVNVLYNKNSVQIRDKDTGASCIYNVNNIKIKLPPATTENTIADKRPVQSNKIAYDTYGYTRDNYSKKNANAPDIPKSLKGFARIDHGLHLYYKQMGRDGYKNADNIGKFMEYVADNELGEEDIDDEFNNAVADCTYIDFDENFPLNADDMDDNKDNTEKIFKIIKYCYKYGFPDGHPDYEANNSTTYYNNYQDNNHSGMYSGGGGYGGHQFHGHHGHHGYGHHYEAKPVWDEKLDYIMPPIKENIIKDEHIIDTLGELDDDDDDNKDNNEQESDESEEERKKKMDLRVDRPVIERKDDIPEEEMSSESELYAWEQEPETYQHLSGLQRIDNGLRIYYEKLGRRNYQSKNNIGRFMEYAEDNGLDSEEIDEEFEVGAEECTFVEFVGTEDEDKLKFPLSIKTTSISEINEKIYRLIKYCHQHAAPPISHVNDADISLINGYIRKTEKEIENFTIPVVILEVIREFYPSAQFFFSFDDDWSLKITKDDISETKRIIKKQLKTIVEEGDLADLIPVITMGRLNKHFPLMQYLFDAYIRAKVKIFLKFGYGTRLFNTQPESWLLKYPFCNKLKIKDPKSFNYFFRGLKQYNYAKLFPCVVPMSLSIKDRKQIKDDLYQIFYYFSGVIQFINETTNGQITPFQFDFTIIFYKVFQMDGVLFKDGTTPILTVKKKNPLGNIEEKLKHNECCFCKKEIQSDDIIDSKFILQNLKQFYTEFKTKIEKKLALKKEDDYPKRWRICLTVDRRQTNDEKAGKDLWFLYEARIKQRENEKLRICYKLPKGLDSEFDHLIPEMYHINSMECLIPGTDHKTDIRTRLSYGITLSFHCQQINQIKAYLWWDNSFMRFMTSDLNTLLPCWFYDEKDYEKNAKFIDDDEIKKEVEKLSLTDLHFKDFLKSWTLKK